MRLSMTNGLMPVRGDYHVLYSSLTRAPGYARNIKTPKYEQCVYGHARNIKAPKYEQSIYGWICTGTVSLLTVEFSC